MQKTIKIISQLNYFKLSYEGTDILIIQKDNLVIDGKNLFDNFFSKLDLKVKVELSYDIDQQIVDSNDRRIVKDIQDILNSVAEKLNSKFHILTEDEDDSIFV